VKHAVSKIASPSKYQIYPKAETTNENGHEPTPIHTTKIFLTVYTVSDSRQTNHKISVL
jgi:hypothetical protein